MTYTDFPTAPAQDSVLKELAEDDCGYAYNSVLTFEVNGRLDTAELSRAVDTVVAHHEPLRTSFPLVAGRRLQRVHNDGYRVLVPPDTPAESLVRRSFDIENGPLAAISVVRQSPEQHRIIIVTHMLVADAWSIRVLLRDLGAAYAGNELPALEIQCADWAVAAREASERITPTQLDFWRAKLHDVRPFPNVPKATRQGLRRRAALRRETATAVRALITRGFTGFTIFAAAYALLLSRRAGGQRIALRTPLSERDDVRLEEALGFFVDLVPLVVDLDHAATFADVVHRVRLSLTETVAWRDAAKAVIAELTNPPAHFAFRGAAIQPVLLLKGCDVREVDAMTNASKMSLGIIVDDTGDGFSVLAEFDAAAIGVSDVKELVAEYDELLLDCSVAGLHESPPFSYSHDVPYRAMTGL